MSGLFNMDNKFFVFMGRVADLMILNLLCIICCIPIVTIGPSITAMYYVTLKMVRNEESYIVKGFFKSFRQNLKQGIVITLIMLIFGVLIVVDMKIMGSMEGTVYQVFYTIFLAMAVVYFMIYMYIYPVLAKFYNSIKNTFINSLLMSIRHLPYTVLMIGVTALPFAIVLLVSNETVQSMMMLYFILLGVSLVTYLNSYFLVKIFDNYIPKEEEESEEDKWENLEAIKVNSDEITDENGTDLLEEAAVTEESHS